MFPLISIPTHSCRNKGEIPIEINDESYDSAAVITAVPSVTDSIIDSNIQPADQPENDLRNQIVSPTLKRTNLIDDIYPIILECFLGCSESEMEGQRDLADFALVSRSWLYHVRRELYKHPKLHTFRSCSLITTTLSNNPDFVSFLRAIDIAPQTNINSSSQRMEEKRCILALMGCLVPFEGLGSTQLQIQLELRFTCAETMIPMHIGPLLTSLTLVNDLSEGGTKIDCARIMKECPNLKSIGLLGVIVKIPVSSSIAPCNIEQFILADTMIARGYETMQYLLHGKWHVLRTLEISNSSLFMHNVAEILQKCTGLQLLKLSVLEQLLYSLDVTFNSELDPIPSLRTLHLCNFEVIYASHIIRCCPNVEVVILEGNLNMRTYMVWQDVLRHGSMKKLKRVEVLSNGVQTYLDGTQRLELEYRNFGMRSSNFNVRS